MGAGPELYHPHRVLTMGPPGPIVDAEILRLAMRQQGRLTAVEVASALALPGDEAKNALDALVTREVADLEVTDDGVLVYTFHDARYLDGTSGAKGLLDG